MKKTVPYVDLFAGPGGLSEGFSRFDSWSSSDVTFKNVLSIEKTAPATRTLRLRAFFRSFPRNRIPDEYWQVIRGERDVSVLARFPEWRGAEEEVWEAELGAVPAEEVYKRISTRLGDNSDWILLGGPPCQAYSLVGRSRMTGIGHVARQDASKSDHVRAARLAKFGGDKRHTLYREYLRILAVHQPSAFVMENVKGILSARIPDESGSMFDRIRRDLEDPWSALAEDADYQILASHARPGRPRYRLLPFASARSLVEYNNRDFLIRAEEFGVPQKRHRVIILGIRDDVEGEPGELVPQPPTTVRDAIGHLPRLRSGRSRGEDNLADWREKRSAPFQHPRSSLVPSVEEALLAALNHSGRYLTRGAPFVEATRTVPSTALEQWLGCPELEGFVQHETRGHMDSDLGRYVFAAAAAKVLGRTPKLQDWPPWLLPEHRNITLSQSGEIVSAGFDDRFKVQIWSEAGSTVTSHIAKDGHYFIHPDPVQTRSLTVREAARLQTFPDDYFFCGNRTEAYTQVGNAVPPLLAVQLAGAVAKLFEAREPPAATNRRRIVAAAAP